jgi:hypothetical protein
VAQEAELKTAPLVAVDAAGAETPLKVEAPPPVVAADRAEPAAAVEVAPPAAAPAPAPAPDPAPASLPETSSPFPLLGLIGLGSLAFSGLMSRLSKRG